MKNMAVKFCGSRSIEYLIFHRLFECIKYNPAQKIFRDYRLFIISVPIFNLLYLLLVICFKKNRIFPPIEVGKGTNFFFSFFHQPSTFIFDYIHKIVEVCKQLICYTTIYFRPKSFYWL